jgi:hypothetical protein
MRVSVEMTERQARPGTGFALRGEVGKSIFVKEPGSVDDAGTFKGEGLDS